MADEHKSPFAFVVKNPFPIKKGLSIEQGRQCWAYVQVIQLIRPAQFEHLSISSPRQFQKDGWGRHPFWLPRRNSRIRFHQCFQSCICHEPFWSSKRLMFQGEITVHTSVLYYVQHYCQVYNCIRKLCVYRYTSLTNSKQIALVGHSYLLTSGSGNGECNYKRGYAEAKSATKTGRQKLKYK